MERGDRHDQRPVSRHQPAFVCLISTQLLCLSAIHVVQELLIDRASVYLRLTSDPPATKVVDRT
jgi:hypothetical protein